jgi:predicted RNase H-like HicB family nuclease
MRKKASRRGTLSEYVSEVLKNAVYEKGEELDVVVAEAPDLPGCMTQAASFEEARESLVDAIEVWLMSGLRCGEDPPIVNGCRLAITVSPRRPGYGQAKPRLKA